LLLTGHVSFSDHGSPIATIRNEKLEVSDWAARPQGAGFEESSSSDGERGEE
jgi:hypothetical protein